MSGPGPVSATERHHVLDVLRGIAVLGILVTNIQHFAMFAATTRDPTLWGDLTGANLWVYGLTFTLFYQKFLPIFSMLFGAGLVLSAERRERAGLPAGRLHYRRMALLLVACPLWLRSFRFGPAEWAWRSLTYGALQPLRRVD